VLGSVALALVGRQIEWARLVEALSGIALGWLLLAGIIDLLAFALRALKWRTLLRGSTSIAYPPVFRATVIGALVTDVLPFRLDELVRAHLIGHHTGLPRARILGTIAVERTLDVLALVTLLGLLAFNLTLPRELYGAGLGLAAVALLFGLIYSFSRNRNWAPSFVGRLVAELIEGVRATRGRTLPAAGVCLLEWLTLFAMFWAILSAFGMASAELALAMLVTSFLVFAFPLLPGAVGIYEAAISALLVARGFAVEEALAIALAAHLVILAPTTLLGAVFLMLEDLGLGALIRNSASATASAPLPRPQEEAA